MNRAVNLSIEDDVFLLLVLHVESNLYPDLSGSQVHNAILMPTILITQRL